MTKRMNYGQLEELLISLGFEMEEVKGSHRIFNFHPMADAIFLPCSPRNRLVMPAHLALVRYKLADLGIADSDEFAVMVHERFGSKHEHNGSKPR
jgi:predicted RNA binding protein YcfA (HicA-like mRNA interferase family)